MKQLILSDEKAYSKETASYLVQRGKVYVNMPVKSAIILKFETEQNGAFRNRSSVTH